MISSFVTTEFENNHVCVSWRGHSFSPTDEFMSFLRTNVRVRLDDEKETKSLQTILEGLALTEMGKENLSVCLSETRHEERNWAAGESLAEAYLIETRGVIFPWNMERDKRNPASSLPGADLIGFVAEGTNYRFVLGEVKTSSEEAYPPKVMSASGMPNQIEKLAQDKSTRFQLIKWLFSRTKDNEHCDAFKRSCTSLLDKGSLVLFGVLIRDTQPNERDLSTCGEVLRDKIVSPTQCDLIALYLPWKTDQLIPSIRKGGEL